jgi:hypothetical protein
MTSVSRRVCRATKHQAIRRLIVKHGDKDTITELDQQGWIAKARLETENDDRPEETNSVSNAEVNDESKLSFASSDPDSQSGLWDGNLGPEWGDSMWPNGFSSSYHW